MAKFGLIYFFGPGNPVNTELLLINNNSLGNSKVVGQNIKQFYGKTKMQKYVTYHDLI